MKPTKPPTKNPTKTATKTATKTQAHQVRIIGGLWKRTPLNVISAEGLRPTPDRVRETLFNWISHLIGGQSADYWQAIRCCDLFAGSGALGFEAASRGAQHVLMVEALTTAYKQLELTKEKLKAEQIQLIRGDALIVANKLIAMKEQFDVIFLDPPFHANLLPSLLPLCEKLLKDNAYLYVESEQALPFSTTTLEEDRPEWCKNWRIIKQDKAGMVHFHLLQRN